MSRYPGYAALMTNTLGAVGKSEYVLLTTFRKDGTPVGTAVWAVADADKLYVWTVTDSWKVKRLRRNPAVIRVYAINCAIHYHMHRLVRALQARDRAVLNTF